MMVGWMEGKRRKTGDCFLLRFGCFGVTSNIYWGPSIRDMRIGKARPMLGKTIVWAKL